MPQIHRPQLFGFMSWLQMQISRGRRFPLKILSASVGFSSNQPYYKRDGHLTTRTRQAWLYLPWLNILMFPTSLPVPFVLLLAAFSWGPSVHYFVFAHTSDTTRQRYFDNLRKFLMRSPALVSLIFHYAFLNVPTSLFSPIRSHYTCINRTEYALCNEGLQLADSGLRNKRKPNRNLWRLVVYFYDNHFA